MGRTASRTTAISYARNTGASLLSYRPGPALGKRSVGEGGKIWRAGQLRNSQARYACVRETRVDPLFGGPLRMTLSDHRQRQVAAPPILFRLSTRGRGLLRLE